MFFRPSARLLRRWTEDCDSILMQAYEKYGPAWGFLASQIKGRTGMECRKRWLILSGTLEKEKFEADKKLWLDGYERITLSSTGQKGWIRVPDVEKIPEDPFERIAKHLPKFKTNWLKKRSGWSEIELMALREAYEQYIVPLKDDTEDKDEKVNQIWDQIAKRFSRRTGPQCRNYFHKQHIFWDSENKVNQVLSEVLEMNKNE